ncbi:MAG: YicC/YloC family endoribonuclease [Pseudomonadota bacterium]
MTGFARAGGVWTANAHDDAVDQPRENLAETDYDTPAISVQWAWEIKSVNSRGLDIRFRVPNGLDALEIPLRKRLADRFSRGSFSVSLTLEKTTDEVEALEVDEQALDVALGLIDTVRKKTEAQAPHAEAILSLPGVLKNRRQSQSAWVRNAKLADALKSGFDDALADLDDARRTEGASLAPALAQRVAALAALNADAKRHADTAVGAIHDRFSAQISTLLGDTAMSEERLAQEAAALAVRADISEELDRIDAHIASATKLIDGGGVLGRKLDFLTQEFNREANTLSAKAATLDLKEIGLEMKSQIDQLREQIQNVE